MSIPYEPSTPIDQTVQLTELQSQIEQLYVYGLITIAIMACAIVYLYYRIRLLEINAVPESRKEGYTVDLGVI